MKTAILLAVSICAIVLASTFFPIDIDVPDPPFLARDVYFSVGDFAFSAPVVAVQDVTVAPKNQNPLPTFRTDAGIWGDPRDFATTEFKNAMLDFAADPRSPATVSSVNLYLRSYGTYGEHLVSSKICPLLSHAWSQKVCRNEKSQELAHLPHYFRLTTGAGLEQYRRGPANLQNGQSSDRLNAMFPLSAQTKMACADGRTFCLSGIAIADDLYAV